MSYRNEAGYGDDEQALINSCVTKEQKDHIDKIKPKLSQRQVSLLSAFYRLSQERALEQGAPLSIKDKDIVFYNSVHGSCGIPTDLFMIAIHDIDSEYIKQRCEEIRRKQKG